ncbi:MAG: BspA family leucine-rich repeat surface protein [Prevotella sp.]|nr:BspA family leucine-rich repeat surface protein [Prevotella sp.]
MKSMKLFTVLLLATMCLLPGNLAMANPITVDDARQNALEFFSSGKARRVKGNLNLSLAYSMKGTTATATDDEAVLYAFNINDGNGFVIVSGDDVAVPILGYCDKGSFDADNLPCNVKAWLNSYAEEIASAKAHGVITSKKSIAPKKAKSSVDVLVDSEWGQRSPYNYQCVFDGDYCATGCVATAMAQVMYYWGTKGAHGETYPCGSKSIPSYNTITNHYTVGELDQIDSFDWTNMTMNNGYPSTAASKEAVAQLMRYCGQSVKMDYTPEDGSGAYMQDVTSALSDYFGYYSSMSFEYISYVDSVNQEALNWNDIIYNQLADEKPVLMACSSHAFICDGYDANTGKFHFNWGWDGNLDGWYEMHAGYGAVYLKYAKEAIINIQPEKRKQYAVLSADESTLTFYFDDEKDSREGTVFEIKYDYTPQYWWQTPDKHQGWYGIETITDVVFDESFANARPTSTSNWFAELRGLVNIFNMENLNMSKVTDMSGMFSGCFNLESFDVGGYDNFDTSNVTDMSHLFANCVKLYRVPLDYFGTQNVTDMSYMFYNCSQLSLEYSGFGAFYTPKLTNMSRMFAGCFRSSNYVDLGDFGYWDYRSLDLDLSFFDTSNVTDMSGLFEGCDGLSSIDLSSFTTANVTNMSYMFSGCSGLSEIDLSNFETSKVTDMSGMFSGCSGLSEIDLSNFETSQVTDMSGMFSGCSGLPSIDLGNFETYNVTNMGSMFSDCSGLPSIGLGNFETSQVTDMSGMFSGCSGLLSIDLGNFETSKVTNMGSMFSGCSGLPNIGLRNFDTSNVTDMSYMFSGCSSLTNLDISCFVTSKVRNMRYMFNGCSTLTNLDVCHFETSKVTDMGYMFSKCSRLSSLNLNNFNTTNVTNLEYMFSGCSGVSTIDLSSFNTSNVKNLAGLFSNCSNLSKIDVSNFETSKVTNMMYVFNGCSELGSLNISMWDMSKITAAFYTTKMMANCIKLKDLSLPYINSSKCNSDLCYGVGTESSPCVIHVPDDFDFGVDTSGDYFIWKKGYFCLANDPLVGDVNGDGLINITDVVCLSNHVLGNTPSLFILDAADVNADGIVNVTDVVDLVNQILGQD